MTQATIVAWILFLTSSAITIYLILSLPLHLTPAQEPITPQLPDLEGKWHPPSSHPVTNLTAVLHGSGVFGIQVDASRSHVDDNGDSYDGWNWCNMPHVSSQSYKMPDRKYKLEYVEIIQRHHKRTPYAANLFPNAPPPWDCSHTSVYSYSGSDNVSASQTYFHPFTDPSNPFSSSIGENPTCRFPQITSGGLSDSFEHGRDLRAIYHDLLSFLPSSPDVTSMEFRVTNNPITSHIASAVIAGLSSSSPPSVPLHVQPSSIDTLEPTYPCPHASSILGSYGPNGHSRNWTAHLSSSKDVFAILDALSGVDSRDKSWHRSWDHYFDNLSARLCHSLPLPCSPDGAKNCLDQATADIVLRLGMYEYSYLYRAHPSSLTYSVLRFGGWIAELVGHIRRRIDEVDEGRTGIKYRHNIAHDGSLAALLSILQVAVMIWPGMGAEVVFEVYSIGDSAGRVWFVRVLWGGVVLKSSVPDLGSMDMLPVDTFLTYFEGLIGGKGGKLAGYCGLS